MYVLKLSVCVFLVSYTTCTQRLYTLIPEHCEITKINKSLVNFHFNRCRKFSRTKLELNANFTLNVDVLSDESQIKITGYQFRSNEYRQGPIEFMLGTCQAFNSREYDIRNLLSTSNLRCPLFKGRTYYMFHMSPNATNMPPLIPDGRWKFDISILYLNKYSMFTLEWYTEISYPILFK